MDTTMQKVRIRRDIETMKAYTPTASLEVFAEDLGYAPEDLIKLDANENPFGTSPKVYDALANLSTIPIYPDPEARRLRALLSDYTGVPAEHILVGAGADELIELVLQLFIEPGDSIITCPPTFSMYAFDAPLAHAQVINVPRHADFSLDVESIAAAVAQHQSKLLFLCSPNNPDGGLLPDDTLQQLLELPITVVLDEAYIEFSGVESAAGQVLNMPNLIILRTMSKWAGLAGLRVGYGIFPAALMPHLWKIKQPYNLNVAADAAARASLNDLPLLLQHIQHMIAGRERLQQAFAQLPFLHPYPSHSNFVLCRVEGMPALDLKNQLAQRGILIRYFNKPGLTDHVRISAGTPQQLDALFTALQEIGTQYE